MDKVYRVKRAETRVPMAVAVHISGNQQAPGTEATFTENVSGRGARVFTARRWQTQDRLEVASPPGNFRATGRVAYCQTLRGEGFAIGIEFLEHAGRWVVTPPAPEVSHNE